MNLRKTKSNLQQTSNRLEYNRISLFQQSYWSKYERNRLKRTYYGTTVGNKVKYPSWKFQKVSKQWMKTPFKKEIYISRWYKKQNFRFILDGDF